MSETRRPDLVFYKIMPLCYGNKPHESIKFELFSGKQFARKWEPATTRFSPKAPLRSDERKEFWESRYRVRVDGRWMNCTGSKYLLMTLREVAMVMGLA